MRLRHGTIPSLVVLALWCVQSSAIVQVAFSRSSLHGVVDIVGWGWTPALGAGLLSLAMVAVAGIAGWPGGGGLAGVALLLGTCRLLSLWYGAGGLFPFLTILWSPLASIALSFVAVAIVFQGILRRSGRRMPSTALLAALLTTASLFAYGAWAVYSTQLTMAHGDAAHYLLATKSILDDGDIDLANNASAESIGEFRRSPFSLHRAPATPPGTSYSVHPPGLSALLAPAYAAGRHLWEHPRLGTRLAMALIAALFVGQLFVFLTQLGLPAGACLVTTVVTASTVPLALLSVEVYPDLPATLVLVTVLARLVPWTRRQVPAPPGGWAEMPRLGAAALLTGLLPLLHPRFLPLSLLLAVPLLRRARTQTGPLLVVAATGGLCLAAQMVYHIDLYGDWLGPLRPGNAWSEDALQLSMWPIALPGHWLHATKGLIVNAPIWLLCLVGAGRLAAARDPRLLMAALLYGATAGVNALHPVWNFGFSMPSRFVSAALPALALLLAAALPVIWRHTLGRWLAALLLLASWETLYPVAGLPTAAYDAGHVFLRNLAAYYPLEAHLMRSEFEPPGGPDLLLWSGVAVALLAAGLKLRRRWRAGIVVATCLLPALSARLPGASERLAAVVSPRILALADDDPALRGQPAERTLDLPSSGSSTGRPTPTGGMQADDSDPPGVLASFRLPVLRPGLLELTLDDCWVSSGGSGESVIFVRRETLPAVQRWEMRSFTTVDRADGAFHQAYWTSSASLGQVIVGHDGRGRATVGRARTTFQALSRPQEARIIDTPSTTWIDGAGGIDLALPAGRYRVRFDLDGQAWDQLLLRHSVPVLLAVFAVPRGDEGQLRTDIVAWRHSDRRLQSVLARPDTPQPLVERIQAPWWIHLPGSRRAYELPFTLAEPMHVALVARYDGPAELTLEQVHLLQEGQHGAR